MKRISYFTYTVAILAILCLYSSFILNISNGTDQLGVFSKPLLRFATFPQRIQEVLISPEVNNLPASYILPKPSFEEINNLDYDVFGLCSFWNRKSETWDMKLFNFKNDSIYHTWHFYEKNYQRHEHQFQNSVPKQLVAFGNKNLIGRLTQSPNLFRLDEHSNIIWSNQEMLYHHSINLDADSNIYVCAGEYNNEKTNCKAGIVKNIDGALIAYPEDYIVKVAIETGETLYKKGVGEILLENGFKGVLYGGSLRDPIHINDIEPVLEDAEYWKEGDLFVSLRSPSLVFLYRPSTNKIIKMIQGPFLNQHDVDILSSTEIGVFNNNYIIGKNFAATESKEDIDSLNTSEILIYNFETDSFSYYLKDALKKENLVSYGEGLYHMLPNEDIFIEELFNGGYHILNDTKVLLRSRIHTPDSNYIYRPSWIRIYNQLPY